MYNITKKDFYFQNDYYDRVVENPKKIYKTDGIAALYIAGKNHIKGYKIFDYLFVEYVLSNQLNSFLLNMYNNGLYSDYIYDITTKSDKFIKAYAALFLNEDFLEEDFNNDTIEVAKSLVETEGYEADARLAGLLAVSNFECSKETIKYLKDNILRIIDNDEKYNKKYTAEEREILIIEYTNYVDESQKKINNSCVAITKKKK